MKTVSAVNTAGNCFIVFLLDISCFVATVWQHFWDFSCVRLDQKAPFSFSLTVPFPQLQILPAEVDPGAHPRVQHVDTQEDPLSLQEVHPALQRLPGHRLQP